MQMSDKTYDNMKWIVWAVLPALATLIGSLGVTLGWANTDIYVTIITAITAFLGTVTGVSNRNYNKEEN